VFEPVLFTRAKFKVAILLGRDTVKSRGDQEELPKARRLVVEVDELMSLQVDSINNPGNFKREK
jgi:hypothetical protein